MCEYCSVFLSAQLIFDFLFEVTPWYYFDCHIIHNIIYIITIGRNYFSRLIFPLDGRSNTIIPSGSTFCNNINFIIDTCSTFCIILYILDGVATTG